MIPFEDRGHDRHTSRRSDKKKQNCQWPFANKEANGQGINKIQKTTDVPDNKKKKKGRGREGEEERRREKNEDDEAAPNHRKARVLWLAVEKGNFGWATFWQYYREAHSRHVIRRASNCRPITGPCPSALRELGSVLWFAVVGPVGPVGNLLAPLLAPVLAPLLAPLLAH